MEISLWEFLTGTRWSPILKPRAHGVLPLVGGTMLVSVIAILFAAPVGLGAAIYLSEYAADRVRRIVKPILEVLAGVPTIVYGYFALTFVTPYLQTIIPNMIVFNALSAGLVMGIMIIPFVSSISDDVINAVPQNLKDGSLGIGATKSETIKKVIIPAALPGIIGGLLLAVSRAIGETMIVVMAAGMSANSGVIKTAGVHSNDKDMHESGSQCQHQHSSLPLQYICDPFNCNYRMCGGDFQGHGAPQEVH